MIVDREVYIPTTFNSGQRGRVAYKLSRFQEVE